FPNAVAYLPQPVVGFPTIMGCVDGGEVPLPENQHMAMPQPRGGLVALTSAQRPTQFIDEIAPVCQTGDFVRMQGDLKCLDLAILLIGRRPPPLTNGFNDIVNLRQFLDARAGRSNRRSARRLHVCDGVHLGSDFRLQGTAQPANERNGKYGPEQPCRHDQNQNFPRNVPQYLPRIARLRRDYHLADLLPAIAYSVSDSRHG